MVNRYVIGTGLLLIVFCAGWQARSWQCERDMAALRAAMQEELNLAYKYTDELSAQLQQTTHELDTKVVAHEKDIHNTYNALVDGLQHDTDSSAGESAAQSTSASCQLPACDCRRYAESKRAFRELQKNLLTLTRDCDVLAVRYNELLEYNQTLRNLLNQ